jgi:hypothetical protein
VALANPRRQRLMAVGRELRGRRAPVLTAQHGYSRLREMRRPQMRSLRQR